MVGIAHDVPRFCQGCEYNLRGLPGGACPECGRAFEFDDPRTFDASPRLTERKAAAIISPLGLVFFAGLMLFTLLTSALGYDPTLPIVVAAMAGPLLGVILTSWVICRVRTRRPGFRTIAAGLILLAVHLSILVSNWPLRLTFWKHQPAFDRLADAIQNNTPYIRSSEWVGMFKVEATELRPDGTVVLVIDNDPGGIGGFFRGPASGAPPRANIWSDIRLNDRWHLIHED